MATNIDLEDIMFECPVCFGQIDETWKMLTCQHTFCSECLEKLYESSENPQCPTCREVIAVSIAQLQRPRLLFTLFDKYKMSRTEKNQTKEDQLSLAIEQSLDDYRENQDLYQENERLQIALCQSADQALIQAEKESLLSAKESNDLAVAYELSSHEHIERELNLSRIEELELLTALSESLNQEAVKISLGSSQPVGPRAISHPERNAVIGIHSADDDNEFRSSPVVELTVMMQACSFQPDDSNQAEFYPEKTVVSEFSSVLSDDQEKCRSSSASELALASFVVADITECCATPTNMCTSEIVCCESSNSDQAHDEVNSVLKSDFGEIDVLVDECGSIDDSYTNTKTLNSSALTQEIEESALMPSITLSIPNLSNYLRIRHRRPVLDTIVIVTAEDKKLNSLEKCEVLWYLETIDDYLDALKYYRRDQITEILDECGENRESIALTLFRGELDDDCGIENASNPGPDEDRDLALALELSRQTSIGMNEDALMDITLKKSAILDPIDSLRIRFSDIKEKLEFQKIVIESNESDYDKN